ncbi:MAG TPA: branched-chain amino acid ABC transporter permease [Anaeromyxobacteraceae bacterium]|nr:branched-chain amino acid ABC transporter permease [Anaeromyxobacteraceae bacterium]
MTTPPPSSSRRRSPLAPVAAVLAAGAALGLVPAFVSSPYALHLMVLFFLSVIMGSAWNLIGGYGGQYSVGHAAYFGVGAYTVVVLLQFRQVAPWWGLVPALALAMALALVIGSITFRLRGPYFVLASIAVAEIVRLAALNWKDLTNGAEGILVSDIPPLVVGGKVITNFVSKVPFYYSGLALALAVVLVTVWVERSKLGYYLQAIREDQDAANSLGIPLTRYKNVALVLSASFTAWAGALYALYVGFIDPATGIGLDISVQIVLTAIIGGIGTVGGPVVGAAVLVALSEALRANLVTDLLVKGGLVGETSKVGLFLRENLAHAHMLIYGLLVALVILFMPEGVVGALGAFARRRRQRLAREAP